MDPLEKASIALTRAMSFMEAHHRHGKSDDLKEVYTAIREARKILFDIRSKEDTASL